MPGAGAGAISFSGWRYAGKPPPKFPQWCVRLGLLLGRIAYENGNRIPFAVRHPHESRVVESDPFTPFVPVSRSGLVPDDGFRIRQPGRQPVGSGRAGEHRPDDEVPILRCERGPVDETVKQQRHLGGGAPVRIATGGIGVHLLFGDRDGEAVESQRTDTAVDRLRAAEAAEEDVAGVVVALL